MTPRQTLWIIIAVSAAFRLIWASSLGGFTNEPYYYMYANELDWGFFDHPPMVGAIAAVGLKLAPVLGSLVAFRLGFIVMFAGSTWLMARLTERLFSPWAGILAALVLNATFYHGVKIGAIADPDGPLLFFWLLTLDRLWIAFENPERNTAWALAGMAWGAALASKYHAVLLMAGVGLYMISRPSNFAWLKRPGPYIAIASGFAVFSPVILWNARHEWISFFYQGNRAGGFQGIKVEYFLEALVAQILYITPWIWGALMVVMFQIVIRGPKRWSKAEGFLVCQAIPPLALFMGVSTFRRIMPHWPLIAFIPLIPLLGSALVVRLETQRTRTIRALGFMTAFPAVLALLFVIQADFGLFQDGKGKLLGMIPAKADPTVDTIRWNQIADELGRRGLLDDKNTFLFTDCWRFSAELAMATHRALPVACYHRDARSFTFWSKPQDWVGRDGIFVSVADGLISADHYAPWFRSIELIEEFPVVRRGVPLQTVKLYRCSGQTAPFLFGYNGPGPVPPPGPELDRELKVLAEKQTANVRR